ncbi:MAG: hypothetical protein ACJA1C_001037 [Crocinitomicaceae bacterium]|jgi:hypothetical protein
MTKENSEKYNEEFYAVIAEGIDGYNIQWKGGGLVSDSSHYLW